MPRMDIPRGYSRRGAPTVGQMRHVVWICTTLEYPDKFVSTIKERPGVYRTVARIRNRTPDQILDYQAAFDTKDAPTQEITIRYPPDVKIDLNHWIYRENGDTQIWYKVRSVENIAEANRFLILNCSVDKVNDARNDEATQKPPMEWETPETFQSNDDGTEPENISQHQRSTNSLVR